VRARGAILLLLGVAFGLTFVLAPWQNELVSDVPLYRAYADLFLHGSTPYGDIAFEYPPLAAPVIALPGFVSLDLEGYRLALAALTLVLLAALALATGRLARLGGGSEVTAAAVVALAPLVTGAMIRTHFDLAPLLCLVAGLATIAGGRPRWGFALLGVGGALKLFPLLAAPVAAAGLVGRGERREAIRGLAIAAGVAVAAAGAAVAISPSGAWDAVQYHVERPVQIESLPATALNALEAAGGRAADPVHSHQSDGLEHPAAGALAAICGALLCAALVALTLAARRSRDPRALALAGLGTAAAFATFGKVLSPQYMLWLVPIVALAWAWRMRALAVAAALAPALTLVWFPERYFDLVGRDTFPLLAVAVRNAVLLLTLVLLARELLRLVRESPAAARSTSHGHPGLLRSAPR
jgi:uncharacterized membrane protein